MLHDWWIMGVKGTIGSSAAKSQPAEGLGHQSLPADFTFRVWASRFGVSRVLGFRVVFLESSWLVVSKAASTKIFAMELREIG